MRNSRRITPQIIFAKSGASSRATIVPYNRPLITTELAAVALLLLVLFLLRSNAMAQLDSAYLGGFFGDAGLYPWLVRTVSTELFSAPWFNTRAFYPYSQTLAWSDNFILPALVAKFLMHFGASLVVAYNLILLTASFLNGYCTYRAVYSLTGSAAAALFSGIGFMSYGYLTLHLGHPQLQFAFFIPLGLSFTIHFFGTRSLLPAFFIGLSGTMALLTSVYYAVFLGLAVFALLGALILLRPFAFRGYDLLKLGVGALAGLAFSIEVVLPYLDVSKTFGARQLYEADAFSATALSYLSAPPLSYLYSFSSGWANAESQLFPGIIVFLLALAAYHHLVGSKKLSLTAQLFLGSFALLLTSSGSLALTSSESLKYATVGLLYLSTISFAYLLYRLGTLERMLHFQILTNRSLVAAALFVAYFFFVFSLGPVGNPEESESALAPYRILYELFPGVDGIRAISRGGIVTILALFIAGGVALPSLIQRFKLPRWIPLILTVLVVVENLQRSYPIEKPEPAPEIFEALKKYANGSGAVLVLPYARELNRYNQILSWGDFARLNVNAMHWAFDTGLPTVNGYSGVKSRAMRELPRQLANFPDQRSIAEISSIAGLRYIVVIAALQPDFNPAEFSAKLARLREDLSVLATDSAGNLLLEYIGKSRITDRGGFSLRVPSYPKGAMQLGATALLSKGKKSTPLKIYLDLPDFTEPLLTLHLPCDGKYYGYQIELPQTADSVRPLILRFEREGGDNVFIRKTRFVGGDF